MTTAEHVLEAWRAKTHTIALGKLVKKYGGSLYDEDPWYDMRFYKFGDGSTIGSRGRGRAFQLWIAQSN